MTNVDLVTLNTELTTDPLGLGYAGKTDPEMAALLNTIGLSSETVSVGVLNGQELQKAVVGAEFIALSAEKQRGWIALISAGDGQVDVDDDRVIAQATAIWNGGSTTLANLAALRTRSASRAEALFGAGVSVGMFDVAEARGL